jgi:Aldehyde dehydrogenase family
MEAGTVWINKHLDILPYVPFGGGKSSGIGRELGRKVWRSSPNSSSSTWRSEKRLVAGETPPATLPRDGHFRGLRDFSQDPMSAPRMGRQFLV